MVNFLFYKEFYSFLRRNFYAVTKEKLSDRIRSPRHAFRLSCRVLPFYIKECGFCSERKFVPGKQYSYNDYLLLYSIDGTARYTKTKTTVYTQPHSVVMSACNTPLTFTRVSREWNFFYFIIGGSHAKLFYNLVRTQNNIISAILL